MPRTTKSSTTKATRTVTKTPRITKSQVHKFLAKVPEEYVFWSNDGSLLRDMRELKDALANMSDQTFAYHTNEIKKDFSNWVRDIIGDELLAKKLDTASNREQAAKIAEERYSFLVSKLEK